MTSKCRVIEAHKILTNVANQWKLVLSAARNTHKHGHAATAQTLRTQSIEFADWDLRVRLCGTAGEFILQCSFGTGRRALMRSLRPRVQDEWWRVWHQENRPFSIAALFLCAMMNAAATINKRASIACGASHGYGDHVDRGHERALARHQFYCVSSLTRRKGNRTR